MKTFIDLFAGVGGFRLALEKRGLECVFTSEIDREAVEIYKANFNDDVHGDITQIHAEDVPEHDILCAGFPCQAFSLNGQMKGLSDPRGTLFYDIFRIAKHHQPSVLLLENVRNILRIQDGEVIRIITEELTKIGYDVHYSVLNSSHFGVPHHRLRVFFACLHRDSGLTYKEPMPSYRHVYLIDVLGGPLEDWLFRDKSISWFDKSFDQPFVLKPIRIGYYKTVSQDYRILHPHGHCTSFLKGGFGALYHIDNKVRMLNLEERLRLLTFPADFKIENKRSSFGVLGNSVVVDMVTNVYDSISRKTT